MFEPLTFLRIVNGIIPILSLPATTYMFWVVFNEKRIVKREHQLTAWLLYSLFLLSTISIIVNILYSVWLLTGHEITREYHNLRWILINGIMFISSWGFVIVRNKVANGE